MVRIDEVVINNVSADEVIAPDGKAAYDIEVNWHVKASGGSFRGPFRIQILCEDQEIKSAEVSVGAAVKLEGLVLDAAMRYHARVTAMISAQSSISSEKIPLLLEKIEEIKAVFDGKLLKLVWKQPSEKVSGAMVTIAGGLTVKKDIERFQAILEIPLYEMTKSGEEVAEIEFMAFTDDKKAYGPPARKIFCLFKQAHISEVSQITDKEEAGEKKLLIKAVPVFEYSEEEIKKADIQLQMYLTDGHGYYIYSDRQHPEKSGSEVDFVFKAGPAGSAGMMKSYQAGVRICSDNFCDEEEVIGNMVPLGQVREEKLEFCRGYLKLHWSYDGIRKPVGFKITDGPTVTYDTKSWYGYEWKDAETGEIEVAPLFPGAIGPGMTVSKNRIPQALYVKTQESGTDMGIGMDSRARGKMLAYVEEEFFDIPWEKGKKEIVGPFTLERLETMYGLTADQGTAVTYEQFMEFLLRLEELGAKKDRIVWACDTIPRFLTLPLEGHAGYAYGLDHINCCCSVTAGMRLKAEWETYRNQQQNKDEDYGFQGSNVSYYEVTAKYPAGQEYLLNFDAFLNQMSGITFEETDGLKENGSPKGFRHSIGGVLDLFHDKFRFPYYSIVYPRSYQSSTVSTTGFEGEHLLLLGSDSIKIMRESLKILEEEYAVLDEVVAAVAYFHGRTAIQPQIQISFRKQMRYVPLGTTLGDLMEESCMPGQYIDRLVFRRSVGGILLGGESPQKAVKTGYLPVYPAGVSESEKMRDIVLMRGDVIDYEEI